MAWVYLGVITLLSEFGLGTTVVTLRDLGESEVAQLNGLSLLIGVGSFVISCGAAIPLGRDRKSTRLNSSHSQISYAVFCLKKKKNRATTAANGLNNSRPTLRHSRLNQQHR